MHSSSISISVPIRSVCGNFSGSKRGGMHKSGSVSGNKSSDNSSINSLRMTQPQQSIRRLGLCSQLAQHSSPIVFPEKRSKKVKASSRSELDDPQFDKPKLDEHRIDIAGGGGGGDEKSDLLGYVVYSGKLVLDKRKTAYDKSSSEPQSSAQATNQEAVSAKLTSKALVWGSHVLPLDDVISVYYILIFLHFLHSQELVSSHLQVSSLVQI